MFSFFKFIQKMLSVLAASCLFSSAVLATAAMVPNASFSTFVAVSDSFVSWEADKDATGAKFTITQETTGANSAPGCLKMAITPGADTSTECRIGASITGLPANKIVTISAMWKYADMPGYWNAMLNLQQATLLMQAPWTWTDRKWTSGAGNNPGTAEWTPVSFVDTTADGVNVIRLIISLSNAGTLWVDDITVTYTDLAPVLPRTTALSRHTAFRNNRISFSRQTPYSLKVCCVNGKILLQQSGTAAELDLNRLDLTSGTYLVDVKTAEKSFTGRLMVGR